MDVPLYSPPAGNYRYKLGATNPRTVQAKAGVEIKMGDLVFREGASDADAIPAHLFPWTTDAATTLGAAGPLFCGVAQEYISATDTNRTLRVSTTGVFQYPDSGAAAFGGNTMFAPKVNTNVLDRQALAVTTTAGQAIARAYEDYPAASNREIWVAIHSQLFHGAL